jgi:hypothetical protein
VGGRVHGVQLWVNLPAADKMMPPAYQDLRADAVARVEPGPGVVARVVAGEAFGVAGPGSTHTPITYTHLTLEPGAGATTALPADHNVLVYPMVGAAELGGRTLAEGELGVLGPGEQVELSGPATDAATDDGDPAGPSEVLVLSGLPLREPVARYGPFVMNTRQQLIEAMDDFQAGRFTE